MGDGLQLEKGCGHPEPGPPNHNSSMGLILCMLKHHARVIAKDEHGLVGEVRAVPETSMSESPGIWQQGQNRWLR